MNIDILRGIQYFSHPDGRHTPYPPYRLTEGYGLLPPYKSQKYGLFPRKTMFSYSAQILPVFINAIRYKSLPSKDSCSHQPLSALTEAGRAPS